MPTPQILSRTWVSWSWNTSAVSAGNCCLLPSTSQQGKLSNLAETSAPAMPRALTSRITEQSGSPPLRPLILLDGNMVQCLSFQWLWQNGTTLEGPGGDRTYEPATGLAPASLMADVKPCCITFWNSCMSEGPFLLYWLFL